MAVKLPPHKYTVRHSERKVSSGEAKNPEFSKKIKPSSYPQYQRIIKHQSLNIPTILPKEVSLAGIGLSRSAERRIAEKISHGINQYQSDNQSKPITSADIVRNLSEELSDRKNYKYLNFRSLSVANSKATKAIDNAIDLRKRKEFTAKVHDFIHEKQFEGFVRGKPWSEVKLKLEKTLFTKFSKDTELKGKIVKELAKKVIQEVDGYILTEEGAGKFKSFKKTINARAEATVIRTSKGRHFELLNTLTEKDRKIIATQLGLDVEGKVKLGKGSFGTARFARDIDTGEIVVVKKFNDRNHAEAECRILRQLKPDNYLIGYKGEAHISFVDSSGNTESKSYLFEEFGGHFDGSKFIGDIHKLKKLDKEAGLTKLRDFSKKILEATNAFHQQGNAHKDIKPDNLFCTDTEVKLGDYGIVNNLAAIGTIEYSAPETLVEQSKSLEYAQKHDSFSVGMSILTAMLGSMPCDYNRPHLELLGSSIRLNFSTYNGRKSCKGMSGTSILAGNTLDEVIAKLLETDPDKRISVSEALKLPYFSRSPELGLPARGSVNSNNDIGGVVHGSNSEETNIAIKQGGIIVLPALRKAIQEHVNGYQRQAFIRKQPFMISDHGISELIGSFLASHENLIDDRSLVEDILKEILNNYDGQNGGEVQSINVGNKVVTTKEGREFEILESLATDDIEAIKQLYNIDRSGKPLLGQGSFGKVLFAKCKKSGYILVVKVMSNAKEARKEVLTMQKLTGSEGLVTFHDVSYPRFIGKNSSYVFMDFAGEKSLKDSMKDIHKAKKQSEGFYFPDGEKIRDSALQMMQCTNELHEKGIGHCDLHLGNFFVNEGELMLGDFGLSTAQSKGLNKLPLLPFSPPEMLLGRASKAQSQPDKVDSFQMALCLLELKNGKRAHKLPGFQLEIEGQPINLSFKTAITTNPRGRVARQICTGVRNTEKIPGNTLDEVIAKLLEVDPNKRNTIEQAMNLPYFRNQQASIVAEQCRQFFESDMQGQSSRTLLINPDQCLSEIQKTQLAKYLLALPVTELARLNNDNIHNLVSLLTDESQRPGCTSRFLDFCTNNPITKNLASQEEIVSYDKLNTPSLYLKLALASKLANIKILDKPYYSVRQTHSQKSAVIEVAREMRKAIENSDFSNKDGVSVYLKDQLLKIFHGNSCTDGSQLEGALLKVLDKCKERFNLSDNLDHTLRFLMRQHANAFNPSKVFTQQLENPDGRKFETILARSILDAPPSVEMQKMMKKIINQVRKADPKLAYLREWSSSPNKHLTYPVAGGRVKSRKEMENSILNCTDIAIFYDFHTFVAKKMASEPRYKTQTRLQNRIYQNVVVKSRGSRILFKSPPATAQGGIEISPKFQSKNWSGRGYAWKRPVNSYYAVGPFPMLAAKNDIPVGVGSSGRTNVALFAQYKLDCLSGVEALDEDEVKIFIYGLWATLCSDGGHSLGEVLFTAETVSKSAQEKLGGGKKYDLFSQVLRTLAEFNRDSSDGENQYSFYSRVPDQQFQANYRNCWRQLYELEPRSSLEIEQVEL